MNNTNSIIRDDSDLDNYAELLNNMNNTANEKYEIMPRTNNNMSYIPYENENVPQTLKNTAFMPAYLSKHIGKLVKVESLIGDNLETRAGILMTVGAGFIVLRHLRSNNTIICDIYTIKYITVIHDNDARKLIQ